MGCLEYEYEYSNHVAQSLETVPVPVLGIPLQGIYSPSTIITSGLQNNLNILASPCDSPSAAFLASLNTLVGTTAIGTVPNPNLSSSRCYRSFGRNISISLNYSTDVIRFAIASQKNGKEGFDHNRLGMVIPAGPSTIGFIYTSTSSSKSTYSQGVLF